MKILTALFEVIDMKLFGYIHAPDPDFDSGYICNAPIIKQEFELNVDEIETIRSGYGDCVYVYMKSGEIRCAEEIYFVQTEKEK